MYWPVAELWTASWGGEPPTQTRVFLALHLECDFPLAPFSVTCPMDNVFHTYQGKGICSHSPEPSQSHRDHRDTASLSIRLWDPVPVGRRGREGPRAVPADTELSSLPGSPGGLSVSGTERSARAASPPPSSPLGPPCPKLDLSQLDRCQQESLLGRDTHWSGPCSQERLPL